MSDTDLLTQLLYARGPGGEEEEVRKICQAELERYCVHTWVDAAGNLIGVIKGASTDSEAQGGTLILAHLDEIAMTVKRINEDGTLLVTALGGANPVNFGMCPVDILGEKRVIPGVLSFGSMHMTAQTRQGQDVQSGDVHWDDVHIVTRLGCDELYDAGVRPATRVVLSQHWRKPFRLADAVAAHFLDDRAPCAAVLMTASRLANAGFKPRRDLYFVFTTMEEETNAGALFAACHLHCDTAIAVEVGPIASEYGTELSANPIIVAADEKGHYSRTITDDLITAAHRAGYPPQVAVLTDFASDASAILSTGTLGRAGCLAIPTENTHGFEIILDEGIEACANTLIALLQETA